MGVPEPSRVAPAVRNTTSADLPTNSCAPRRPYGRCEYVYSKYILAIAIASRYVEVGGGVFIGE